MHNMGLSHVKNVNPLINKFLHFFLFFNLVANFATIMDQDQTAHL